MTSIDRKFNYDLPSIDYEAKQGKGELKKLHWGQRKLLICEIEFITNHYDKYDKNKEKLCVYAGSASGYHINYLMNMFSDITFHLYDKGQHLVEEGEQVKIFKEYFTDEIAESYKNKNVLFMSDIRTLDIIGYKSQETDLNKYKTDEIIENDLLMQVSWCENMRPLSAMLKFRLPWYKKFTITVDGEIYFQPWAPMRSTEARLIPKLGTVKKWDNKKYEGILNYHNLITRHKEIETRQEDCLGNYYDAISEEIILKKYIDKFKLKEMTHCTLSNSITLFLLRMDKDKIPINTKFLRGFKKLKSILRQN
jgi:cap2 methyltransferase